jgi:hypothetical protein
MYGSASQGSDISGQDDSDLERAAIIAAANLPREVTHAISVLRQQAAILRILPVAV